jgi:hypothetical protein
VRPLRGSRSHLDDDPEKGEDTESARTGQRSTKSSTPAIPLIIRADHEKLFGTGIPTCT